MHDYLVFKLYGPLASWGDIAVGEYRPSFAHPSKSAIIGLLAAALGIRRDEDERQKELADACSFAVRVDAMGILLRDYHTAQVPSEKKGVTRYSELANEKLNTILSTRDYRCDAAYTVAVIVRDGAKYTAHALAEKLKKPEFTLYLGRKSCPLAFPLQPTVITAATLKKAFASVTFNNDELPGVIKNEPYLIYWEDDNESGFNREHVITRRDAPLSRIRWQFSERRECYCSVKKEDETCSSV